MLHLEETQEAFSHAAQITLMIETTVKKAGVSLADLSALAVSQGPGSYTALRIGFSTAKGICYALDKPLITVDTLQALALATWQLEQKTAFYCPMIDARRMEVYAAIFDENNQLVEPAKAIKIESDTFNTYFIENQSLVFSGSGAEKCKTVLTSPSAQFSPVICSAKHLVPLAVQAFQRKDFANLAYAEPFYLKPPNITTSKKKLL